MADKGNLSQVVKAKVDAYDFSHTEWATHLNARVADLPAYYGFPDLTQPATSEASL